MTAPSTPHSGRPPRGPSLVLIGICTGIALVCLIVGISLGPQVQRWISSWQQSDDTDGGNGTWYISQMHPWIIQPNPGQCPICGMDLTPIDPDRFAGEIAIDPVIVQNMGVRVAAAEQGDLQHSIRTVGTVSIDEARVSDVVQRFGGWIETVQVGSQWQPVAAGDPLFTIYAPAVYAAEEEFLLARSRAGTSTGDALLAAARQKLTLLGLPEAEWERLETSGTAAERITVTSPATGYVWQKNINPGSEIAPKTVTYRIVDLDQVWVEATLYEHQLPAVRPGQQARLHLDYGGTTDLTGRIAQIYPSIDARTREVRARLVFPNQPGPSGPLLKPGMFATVFIDSQVASDAVLIPHAAVIGTGDRKVAFVSLGRGKFEPRTVTLGPKGNDGRIAVTSGIAAGEQVVISGQFLLDSESKMREALVKVMQGDLASQQAPPAAAGDTAALPATAATAWSSMLDAYLNLQQALYDARGDSLGQATKNLQTAVTTFLDTARQADEHIHHRHPALAELATEAAALESSSAEALRPGFGALSITLDTLVKTFGRPADDDEPITGMRCGMANDVPKKGVWLQRGDQIRNPYFGANNDMRDCAADVWSLPLAGGNEPVGEQAMEAKETPAAKAMDHHGDHTPTTTMVSPATIDAAIAIQQALFTGDLSAAQQAAGPLAIDGMAWQQPAAAIAAAADLTAARAAFGDLAVALRDALANGNPVEGVMVYRCGMARGVAEKGLWLQRANAAPQNPYFGHEHGMFDCFSQRWQVGPAGLVEAE